MAGKEISRVEIPAFIPRPDLLEQLVRWALSACAQDGASNFGLPMRVEPFHNTEGDDWGCAADAHSQRPFKPGVRMSLSTPRWHCNGWASVTRSHVLSCKDTAHMHGLTT